LSSLCACACSKSIGDCSAFSSFSRCYSDVVASHQWCACDQVATWNVSSNCRNSGRGKLAALPHALRALLCAGICHACCGCGTLQLPRPLRRSGCVLARSRSLRLPVISTVSQQQRLAMTHCAPIAAD
jgi:hypothetical protein